MKRFCLLLALALSGCAQPTAYKADVKPAFHSPVNSHGLSLADAQERSLFLAPSISVSYVTSILGRPDQTECHIAGELVGKPWDALTFSYKWQWGNGWGASHKQLDIAFQFDEVQTNWLVNSWKWREY